MTNESGDSASPADRDSTGPNLSKNPDPSDQFTPYSPPYEVPQYGVPQYEVPQYEAPQYGVPQYGYPAPPPTGSPVPGAVTVTRSLGVGAVVGALLLIAYGWLTYASFEPKGPGVGKSSVNGWGQVFFDGDQMDLPTGANGSPYAAIYIPIFVVPVVILGLLVACNVGRFGNSITIFVLATLHFLLSLAFLAAPNMCILFDDDVAAEVFEAANTFSNGPGAISTTITLLAVAGTSLAGIILGRRKVYPQGQYAPGVYGGYQT